MQITLTQIIDQYIRACGPVSFAQIMREVKTQHRDAPEHEVAAALTGLLGAGPIGLYDDGTSFTIAMTPAPAAPALLTAAKDVIANWEHGDLAAAVRELAAAVAAAGTPKPDAAADVLRLALEGWRDWIKDPNRECSGADMVEWFFGQFVPAAKEALGVANGADAIATWTHDFHCPDCGATAARAGIVCNVCHRGMTERIG